MQSKFYMIGQNSSISSSGGTSSESPNFYKSLSRHSLKNLVRFDIPEGFPSIEESKNDSSSLADQIVQSPLLKPGLDQDKEMKTQANELGESIVTLEQQKNARPRTNSAGAELSPVEFYPLQDAKEEKLINISQIEPTADFGEQI